MSLIEKLKTGTFDDGFETLYNINIIIELLKCKKEVIPKKHYKNK